MYLITFLTYVLPEAFPNRVVYLPAFAAENDMAWDVTALEELPDPNLIMWEGMISAVTLDAWLSDPEIFILQYEEVVNEPL